MESAERSEETVLVRFEPSQREVSVPMGTTLVGAAKAARLPLGSLCEGELLCGMCRTSVLAGADNLSPIEDDERRTLAAIHAEGNERLACLARVHGPVTVTTDYW
jgi:2Fe-2S ferredoxin